ncbi:hypothetical protein HMPREF9296_1160 [Prevotella disiens FB035-09AN]|uniref:Uncharacterized protein n=1 Tax=Prevotella disiens FB035-09AN TaxID=866771 RepID=E1KQS9_9BACT|nr:hypothetical protein HMPREF9296_1160 [Prevotella disiens FB035-09AN]
MAFLYITIAKELKKKAFSLFFPRIDVPLHIENSSWGNVSHNIQSPT